MAEDQTPGVKTVGRYQILEELGRGAMAVVYKGKDPVIGRTVALKTLLFREDNKEMRDLRQALYRDACAAGTLAHPNIVTIYDVIEETGMTAVAMEFIEGRTLDSIIKEQAPLPLDMALDLFDQIVAGLDYAHTRGIIHRDVKPANIMLTVDGRVKVTDFGVARVTSGSATMTATVVGSPSYMSPEQIRGSKLDGRSDLFSVATVFYEMLTKERPFPGDDIATTLYRIVHELPTPPTEFNPAIGPELTRVFERAMAKDPNERYPTGAELARAMRQAGGPASGKSTARVAPVDGTIRIAPPGEMPPAARAAASPAPRARAARARSAAAEAPSQGKPVALIAGAVAAVLVLGVGAYVFFGRDAAAPSSAPQVAEGGRVAQGGTPVDGSQAPATAAPTPGAAVAAPTTDPLAAAPTAPAPAPAPTSAREPAGTAAPSGRAATVPAPRRGGAAGSAGATVGRAARATTPAQTAPPVEPAPVEPAPAPAARPDPPPVVAAPPPPVVATIPVQFQIRGDFYSGLQVAFDDRVIPGSDLPLTLPRVPVGNHTVTYRWTNGARQPITGTVNLQVGPRSYRIVGDPANAKIDLVPVN